MQTSPLKILSGIDWLVLLALSLLLGVFGVFNIYAAAHGPGLPWLVRLNGTLWQRQIFYIVSGIVLMGLCAVFAPLIIRCRHILYGLVLALLVLVLLIGADDATNTARWLWIRMPVIGRISFQPSELAKLSVIITICAFLSTHRTPRHWLAAFGFLAAPITLILLQPSLSAAIIVFGLGLVCMFVHGAHKYVVIAVGLFGVALVALVYIDMHQGWTILDSVLRGFQMRRIETFLHPIEGSDAFFQTQGALLAIERGGLSGVGFLENSHVINGHNDFIFSVIAEQFGFLGVLGVLLGFSVMIYWLVRIGRNAGGFGRIFSAAIAGMFIVQVALHVGVNTNLIPNTGVPLPLMSYGGSMVWVHMAAVGMAAGVAIPAVGISQDSFDCDSKQPKEDDHKAPHIAQENQP